MIRINELTIKKLYEFIYEQTPIKFILIKKKLHFLVLLNLEKIFIR